MKLDIKRERGTNITSSCPEEGEAQRLRAEKAGPQGAPPGPWLWEKELLRWLMGLRSEECSVIF